MNKKFVYQVGNNKTVRGSLDIWCTTDCYFSTCGP